ncbi:SIR2 family protein [Lacticaseibacillus paracasei]|uniref:SIR2 family protein n=1 Tax=Lacticaseibacillus paracasei TaxID=1597 RepID=UPI0031E1AA53
MGLSDLKNQYPIVFIGSGISKRYLSNFPSWTELLEEYWDKIDEEEDIYSFLHNQNMKDDSLSRPEQDFRANIAAATHIQKLFDSSFFQGKLEVKGLTKKFAQSSRISPFKWSISDRFKKLELKKNVNTNELMLFREMLAKAKMIITTNYDSFIEQSYEKVAEQQPEVFVGQQGLFDEGSGWAEIYKIHGSVKDPNSIIINREDYSSFDDKSILVTAKILSSMINYPIIFFGYSLTDLNIRKLLRNFSTQLPHEDIRKTANRIFVVQYEENAEEATEEIVKDSFLDLDYTLITAKEYAPIYKRITQINEGLTPIELQKYSNAIKRLIISQGNKGALASVLLSPSDLDVVMDQIQADAPIVVAIGDNKNIYVTPTPTSYLTDYITKKFDIMPENALRFIARQQNSGRYPFLHHYYNYDFSNPKNSLEEFEVDRLKQRKARSDFDLDNLIKTVKHPPEKFETNDISEILKKQWNLSKKLNSILYNCRNFDMKDFNDYVVHTALPDFVKIYKERNNKTATEKPVYRKLFVAWDIMNFDQKKS